MHRWEALLSLKGRIVTADALNCQRAIAAKAEAPRKSTWISLGRRLRPGPEGQPGMACTTMCAPSSPTAVTIPVSLE